METDHSELINSVEEEEMVNHPITARFHGLDATPEGSEDEGEEQESDGEEDDVRAERGPPDALVEAIRASLQHEEKPDPAPVRDIVAQITEECCRDHENTEEVELDADELKEDLTCVICSSTFYKPATLLCQHTFCRGCLEENPNKTCPLCRADYVVPIQHNNNMDNLTRKCFPNDYNRAKSEEENLQFAKDARKRIEEEIYKRVYNQAVGAAQRDAAQRLAQPAPAAAPRAPSQQIDPDVAQHLPGWMRGIANGGVRAVSRTAGWGVLLNFGTLFLAGLSAWLFPQYTKFSACVLAALVSACALKFGASFMAWRALLKMERALEEPRNPPAPNNVHTVPNFINLPNGQRIPVVNAGQQLPFPQRLQPVMPGPPGNWQVIQVPLNRGQAPVNRNPIPPPELRDAMAMLDQLMSQMNNQR
jgi:hypothetical protein